MRSIAFIWHMHQPCYKDLFSNKLLLPWVRLHTSKDYTGMALLFEEFPHIKATVNFVPSLLSQAADYAATTDVYLDLARRDPSTLMHQEREFIIRNFFHARIDRMIQPWSRYFELYEKRLFESRHIDNVDLLDLQTLANLAWMHPCLFERDPKLRELAQKGSKFSAAERDFVFEKQLGLLKELPGRWRALSERIELTVSPFYHPIVPLLANMDHAKIRIPYGRAFETDAHTQVRRGLEYGAGAFGTRPVGMWLPEMSISEEALRIVESHGVRWVVADEDILYKSGGDTIYEPWAFGNVAVLFRDKELSNLIGFQYQHYPPQHAAEDFVEQVLRRPEGLVVVALDGENPWEHYADGGVPFLRHLYRLLPEAGIETTTPRDYLAAHPPRRTLRSISPGSWINADFGIWSGHEEDARAWELVMMTRDMCGPNESLLAAEGSDWFWWFGPDFQTSFDIEFDMLFRRHLANAFRMAGKPVPDVLFEPVKRYDPTRVYRAPWAKLSVDLDGEVTNFYEWAAAGRFDVVREHDLMYADFNPISTIHFGADDAHFYVRVDFRPGRTGKPRLVVRPPRNLDGELRTVAGSVVEMACPLSALEARPGDVIEFQIELDTPRGPIRLPTIAPLRFTVPDPQSQVFAWEV